MKEVTVQISAFASSGDGLARLEDGRAFFVPFALPGETVRAAFMTEKKRFVQGRLVEILRPSPNRIAPRCKHFTACGGCQLQHIPYEQQLTLKRSLLMDQLVYAGGIDRAALEACASPTVPSPAPWNYRNHVQFTPAPNGQLGFVAAGFQEGDNAGQAVLAVEECHLPEPCITETWPQMESEPVPGLAQIGFRAGAEEDVLLVLESHDPEPPDFSLDLPISVVYLSPVGARVLSGRSYLIQQVLGRVFKVSAASFFQVNTALAGKMTAHILDNIPPQMESALDLYCGGGLFSAFLAPRTRRLISVENSPWGCEDFENNLYEFDHVELYEASVEEVLPALDLTVPPGLVVADPPRSGLGGKVIEQICALSPTLFVYVSCNPATLGRDARLLIQRGYHLQHITPFDLFPQTHHIESISFWVPALNSRP